MLSSNLIWVVTLVKAAQTIMARKGGFLTHNVYCSLGEALDRITEPSGVLITLTKKKKVPCCVAAQAEGLPAGMEHKNNRFL